MNQAGQVICGTGVSPVKLTRKMRVPPFETVTSHIDEPEALLAIRTLSNNLFRFGLSQNGLGQDP